MKRTALLILTSILITAVIYAQEPAAEPEQEESAQPQPAPVQSSEQSAAKNKAENDDKKKPPQLSDKDKATIALLQRDLVSLQAQMLVLQQQQRNINDRLNFMLKSLEKKDWRLDPQTLTYQKAR